MIDLLPAALLAKVVAEDVWKMWTDPYELVFDEPNRMNVEAVQAARAEIAEELRKQVEHEGYHGFAIPLRTVMDWADQIEEADDE